VADFFLKAAIEEAKAGLANGDGIPIGSVLVIEGTIVGRGYNKRFKVIVRFCMRRWIVWRTLADCDGKTTAAQHSTRRSPHVICALAPFYCTGYRELLLAKIERFVAPKTI
jgi:hypothetical protein